MKIFLAVLVGALLGAAGYYVLTTQSGKSTVRHTGDQIESAARSTRDTLQDKLQVLDLRPEDIRDDLAKTGKVIRRKAQEAGKAIADATADPRITASIKAKLLASRDLSSLGISVNTTDGIVTLSGSVYSTEEVSKAMLIAMETDGVKEVISTLQVKPKPAK
jgi:hyperosmotically inducible protein